MAELTIRQTIIAECRESGHTTSIDMARKYGLNIDSVCCQLRRMFREGILSRRYVLSDKARYKPALYQYALVKEMPVPKLKTEMVEQTVLDMIGKNGSVTTQQVYESIGASERLVYQRIVAMFRKGILTRTDKLINGHWVHRYYLKGE